MTSGVDLPADCPPLGHKAADGTFYRLAEKELQPGDKAGKGSWRKPYKVRGPSLGKTDVCGAHALSLFKDLEVLREARALSPWAAGKSIAQTVLTPTMGRVLETPSPFAESHHDWWPNPDDFVPDADVIEAQLEVRL